MSGDDPTPPVAEDDFPEFAEPPRQKPGPEAFEPPAPEGDDEAQSHVDDMIARLRREREQGQR